MSMLAANTRGLLSLGAPCTPHLIHYAATSCIYWERTDRPASETRLADRTTKSDDQSIDSDGSSDLMAVTRALFQVRDESVCAGQVQAVDCGQHSHLALLVVIHCPQLGLALLQYCLLCAGEEGTPTHRRHSSQGKCMFGIKLVGS